MKAFISPLSLASFILLGNAYAQSLPVFDSVQYSVDQISKDVSNQFAFDPLLDVNANQGSFSTSVSLPLGPNLIGINKINLVYSPMDSANRGMGIGWRWSLPEITENFRGHESAPYLTSFGGDNSELTASTEKFEWSDLAKGVLSKKFKDTDLTDTKFVIYRPLLDRNLNLYVRFETPHKKGWLVLENTGQKYIFDDYGTLQSIYDSIGNAIHFNWESGLLTQVAYSQSWALNIEYDSNLQEFPISHPSGFYKTPVGISKAVLKSNITGKQREFRFEYETDGFLSLVKETGAVRTVFRAKYSPFVESSKLEVGGGWKAPVTNSIAKHDDKQVYKNSYESGVVATQDIDPYGITNRMYFDLNGDGISEKLELETPKARSTIAQKIYYISNHEDAVRENAEKRAEINRELDTTENFVSSAKIFWGNLDSGHDWLEEADNQLVPADMWFQKNWIYYDKILSSPRGVFFVDLNRDGMADMIDCGLDGWTQHNRLEIDNDPRKLLFRDVPGTKSGHEDKVIDVKRSHSNVIVSAVRLADPNNGFIKDKAFDAALEIDSANLAKISIQTLRDVNGALDRIDPDKINLKSSTNISGQTKWEPRPTSLRCNSSSQFGDFNRDGYVDVWTGRQVYLGSSDPGTFYMQAVDPHRFIDSSRIHFDPSDTNHVLADLNQDGRFEVYPGRAVLSDPKNGELDLVQNGSTQIIPMVPRHKKVMTDLISDFGGVKRITYGHVSGRWVVAKIQTEPGGDQPVVSTQYNYERSPFDVFSGRFQGFAKVTKTTTESSNHSAPITSEYFYHQDRDFFSSLLSARGRLAGTLLLEKEKGGPDTQPVMRETIYQPKGFRISPRHMYVWNYLQEERVFNPGKKEVGDRLLTQTTLGALSDWIKTDSGTLIGPSVVTTKVSGPGLDSSTSSALMTAQKTTVARSKFISSLFKMVPTFTELKAAGGQEDLREKSTYGVDETTGLIIQKCQKDRCSSAKYDQLGRAIELKDALGSVKTAEYLADLPLITKVSTADGVETREYDDLLGRATHLTTTDGAQFDYEYSSDGLLKTIVKNGGIFNKVPWYEVDLDPKKLFEQRQVNIIENDKPRVLLLDGMGRVEDRVNWVEGAASNGLTEVRDGRVWFGVGNRVVRRFVPSSKSGEIATETLYDSLGRVSEEQVLKTSVETHPANTVYTYDALCVTKTLNNVRTSKECKNRMGQLLSQELGAEKVIFESDDLGAITKIASSGVSLARDQFGTIKESEADLDSPDVFAAQGLASWNLRQRTDKYPGNGFELTEINNRKVQYDQEGRLANAQTIRRNSPYQLNESRSYDKGKLNGRELKYQIAQTGKSFKLTDTFKYDELGSITEHKFEGGSIEIERDAYSRLTKWTTDGQSLGLSYKDGNLSTISNQNGVLIKRIAFDNLGRLSEIEFAGNLKLTRSYHGASLKVAQVAITQLDRTLYVENYEISPDTRETTGRTLETALLKKSEKFQYDPKLYHLKGYEESGESLEGVKRQDGRVIQWGDHKIKWSGFDLASFDQSQLFYDSDGALVLGCHPGNCVRYINADTYQIGSEIVALHRVGNLPVLITKGTKVYLVVADPLNSVKALVELTKEGPAMLEFVRYYDAWGIKTSKAVGEEAKKLESDILFSFAGLREAPSLKTEISPLYISLGERAYAPELKEWMSADPAVVWNPDKLKDRPGNWHPVRYANNKPLDYVDVSGEFVVAAPLAVGLTVGLVSFATEVIMEVAVNGNNIEDVVEDAAWNAGVAAGAAAIGSILPGTVIGAGVSFAINMGYGTHKSYKDKGEPQFEKNALRSVGLSAANIAIGFIPAGSLLEQVVMNGIGTHNAGVLDSIVFNQSQGNVGHELHPPTFNDNRREKAALSAGVNKSTEIDFGDVDPGCLDHESFGGEHINSGSSYRDADGSIHLL